MLLGSPRTGEAAMRSTIRWGECDSSRSALPMSSRALQILLVSYMPLGSFLRALSGENKAAIRVQRTAKQ